MSGRPEWAGGVMMLAGVMTLDQFPLWLCLGIFGAGAIAWVVGR